MQPVPYRAGPGTPFAAGGRTLGSATAVCVSYAATQAGRSIARSAVRTAPIQCRLAVPRRAIRTAPIAWAPLHPAAPCINTRGQARSARGLARFRGRGSDGGERIRGPVPAPASLTLHSTLLHSIHLSLPCAAVDLGATKKKRTRGRNLLPRAVAVCLASTADRPLPSKRRRQAALPTRCRCRRPSQRDLAAPPPPAAVFLHSARACSRYLTREAAAAGRQGANPGEEGQGR